MSIDVIIELLPEIISIISLAAILIAFLKWILTLHKNNKKMKKENETLNELIIKLKSQKYEEYDRRIIEKIKELLGRANKEIQICGLVGHQPIHECNSDLIKLINNYNGEIRILIANPDSNYFKSRVDKEGDTTGRLINAHNSTIIELKDLLTNIYDKYQDNLKVKLYKKGIENVSFWIVDNKEMYVNEYLQNNGQRGYNSPMYKVSKKRLAQKRTFDYYTNLFETAWNDESSIKLDLSK